MKDKPESDASPSDPKSQRNEIPVVGIGASAGGLEALTQFFNELPKNSGTAFVVVTHQAKNRTSLLPELLARETQATVGEAGDGQRLKPDHVYIAPPSGDIAVRDGVFVRFEIDQQSSAHLPIDRFFRSLAETLKERAICIVLSGTASDGTLGLRAVKAAGGMAMVQQPDSAKYSGMPESAIATGLADYVLPPAEMPEKLATYIGGPYLNGDFSVAETWEIAPDSMRGIFAALDSHTGHDFSNYKKSTIHRRIRRRMNINQIEDPARYMRYLCENSHETDLLCKELLISVTSFFRDPKAWEALADGPLPALLEAKPTGSIFRAWIPACTSGEESYSLAILLRECMERIGRHFDVQIFGTDLSADAIDAARRGVFPEGIAADLSEKRLERWFTLVDKHYHVRSEIREMVVFAAQNVIADPPFTKLDMLCCRNMLIYMDGVLQKRVLPTFHYALNPGGLLLLGTAETVGEFTDLFESVDQKWKIFRRRDVPPRADSVPSQLAALASLQTRTPPTGRPANRSDESGRFALALDKAVLAIACPPSVVVNDRGLILRVYGRTGQYLEPAEGKARLNLLDMAREGLPHALSATLRKAQSQQETVVRRRVRVKTNGAHERVDLSVTCLREPEPLRGLLLISFETSADQGDGVPREPDGTDNDAFKELERDLQDTRESLQSTIEELETSNEELKSTNEELQSTNEELQSTNEEMETSKEELQSLNDQLGTVNDQLQAKVDELVQADSDMKNLLENTDIATLFLDVDLRIMRYTEHARELIKLRPGDVGRPIGELSSDLLYPHLERDCREAVKRLGSREVEVEAASGTSFLMRIGPYRTTENVISGVVITFTKQGEARGYFESIVHTLRHPLVVLDPDLRIVTANREFQRAFGLRGGALLHQRIYDIGAGEWNHPQLRRLLEEILPRDTSFEDFDLEFTDGTTGDRRVLMVNARRLNRTDQNLGMILMAIEDVTGRFPPA